MWKQTLYVMMRHGACQPRKTHEYNQQGPTLSHRWRQATCLGVDTIINQAALTLPFQKIIPQVRRKAPNHIGRELSCR